nr:histidine phosphatase family protein [Tissierella sp.]
MEIIMIRHGQSEDNVEGVFGTYNSSLSEKGKHQIEKTRERLKDFDYSRVYYSPFKRTIQTLEILQLDGKSDSRIGEYNFGKFAGMNFEEIEEEYPKEYDQWNRNQNKYIIEDGESLEIVYDRVKDFLEEIIEKDESVVLVTHAGIIRLVLCWVFDDINYFFKFKIENGSINIVSVDEKDFKRVEMTNYRDL